ncbi:hypothetical protein LEMLEM_LOCUS1343 [Lemmus lemmus]
MGSRSTCGRTRATSRSSAKCACGPSATLAISTSTSDCTRRAIRPIAASSAARCWCAAGIWSVTSNPATRARA